MSMKGYHEYLELHSYFARNGEQRLTSVEFESADLELRELAARRIELADAERGRLGELMALLHRDKP
jgi:hypothetical protein